MKHTKQLFLLLLLAIVGNVAAGNVTDELTWTSLGIPNNTVYSAFPETTLSSGAVYNGNAASNSGKCIQLRTSSNSGIVTTQSGGKIVQVEIEWASNTSSGRILDVYGKNTPYESVSDLFSSTKTKQGTKLGSFTFNSGTTILTVSDDYSYIGIRSNSGALYLNYIKITWSNGDSYSITPQSNNTSYGTVSLSGNTITATPEAGYQVSTTTPYEVISGTATVTDNGDNTFTVSASADCTVQINFEPIPSVTHLYIKADSAPHVYTWTGPEGSETKYTGNWPGNQTSTTTEIGGISWYTIDVPASSFNLILNKGNDQPQTGDITGIYSDTYFVWDSSADGIGDTEYQIVSIGEISATNLQLTAGATGSSTITSGLATRNYSSSDTGVATVAADGTVTGVSAGNAVITVYCPVQNVNGTYYIAQTTFNVTVTEAAAQRTYQKVTSTADIVNGKKYLIVYEEGSVAFDGSRETLDVVNNNQEVVMNNGKITTDENIYFTITNGNILSALGKYIGRETDENGLDVGSSAYSNTITIDNDGNANIVGSGGAYLRFNNNTDQRRFRYFTSSTYTNQKAIQLFKEVNDEVVVYVKADIAPYVYTWTGEGSSAIKHTGEWPGTQAQEADKATVHDVEFWTVTVPAKNFNLILNNGNSGEGNQTPDIEAISENTLFVWNSAEDNYDAGEYLIIDGFPEVSANDKSLRIGDTDESNVNSTVEGLAFTYESSNTSVASVTSDGTVTAVAEGTATITVKWATQEISNHHGYFGGETSFTVTVKPALTGDEFVKVTSVDELKAGIEVIIVNEEFSEVMGKPQSNNFTSTSVDIEPAVVPTAVPGEDATILTLEGSSEVGWYFRIASGKDQNGDDTSGKYLYASSSSSNQLRIKEETETDDNSRATIEIDEDGNAIIVFQGTNTRNIIRYNYNNGNPLFSCYGSNNNMRPVQIYYRNSQDYVARPTITPASGTLITEETNITITGAEGTAIYYTTDGSDPVKDGALTGTAKAYTGAFNLNKASTVKAVARDAGGNFSPVASATYNYNGTTTLPYYERFDAGLGNFITTTTGTVKWTYRQHTDQEFIDKYGEVRKYAYCSNSGYDHDKTGKARFISPIIDLTEEGLSNVMFNFIHAGANFSSSTMMKAMCKVQVITDENDKDISDESVLVVDDNWTNITIPDTGWFTYNDSQFTRKNSGDISLDDYVGKKVRICFLFDATDTNNKGNWNVDQISIRGELVEKVNISKPSTSPETETEGYTTYVTKNDIDVAATLTEKGVKLYKVVEFDKRNVVLVQLGLGAEGEGAEGENTYSETMVPAGSPVLVKGEFGERELVLVNSSEVIPKLRGNLLRSAIEGVTATENDHFFVLQYPKSVGAYGFHLLGTGRSFDGRRAYLNGVDEVEELSTQTNPAKGVFMFGEEEDVLPSSIQQLDVPASSVIYSDGVYDLMGRKVNTKNGHLPKGIYVVKGNKFVVK